jgi:putative peptidoglycan lipid II flippase
MHLGVQVPGLIRFRARWTAELGLRDPVLWRVLRLMLPRIAGLGVFSLNFIIMNNIASRLGTGAVSALDWGWRLMQIPQTLIGTAMGVVIFPTLAALSEVGDEDGKRDAMSGALRFILIASIPSAIGLVVIGQPLIGLLERGAFDSSASALVYSTLQFFALGLIVHSALEVVARSFYADKDTMTPLYAALIGAAINLVGSFVFSGVAEVEANFLYNRVIAGQIGFTPDTGNVGGLALANSLGVAFEVGFLLIILRNRWHGANEGTLARTIIKTIIASLVMALSIVALDFLWPVLRLDSVGFMFEVSRLGLEVLVGAIVFFVTAFMLQMQEIGMLRRLIFGERFMLVAKEG